MRLRVNLIVINLMHHASIPHDLSKYRVRIIQRPGIPKGDPKAANTPFRADREQPRPVMNKFLRFINSPKCHPLAPGLSVPQLHQHSLVHLFEFLVFQLSCINQFQKRIGSPASPVAIQLCILSPDACLNLNITFQMLRFALIPNFFIKLKIIQMPFDIMRHPIHIGTFIFRLK
jgi:hypothetical protein